VTDITNPDEAARVLIEQLGQNGAMLYAENEIDDHILRQDAAAMAAWQAVYDRILDIGRRRLTDLGLWR
jgi:hypothetical protein